MKRGTLITVLVVAAFTALLLVSTLRSQSHECTVEVEFKGATNAATASAETEADAERQARTTACGTIAFGMNDNIACANRPPIQKRCRAL